MQRAVPAPGAGDDARHDEARSRGGGAEADRGRLRDLGVRRLYAAAWPTQDGVVACTCTGDDSWRRTPVAARGGSGPCAMTATADGVLLAHVAGAAIRCRRVPLDAGVSEDAHAGAADWHHDSADLFAALKEPQPAATS